MDGWCVVMALNITRGKIAKAQKVVVYGPEGIGKTSFAAAFPNPLFIDTEGSTEHYDVARTDPPKSWTALLAQVQEVKATHPCATLVIDTADWAEKLCMQHICSANNWKSIEDPGFGKGYTPTVEEFCKLLNLLSDVVDAGINVVLTAHAAIRKFDQPDEAASYNRWALYLIDATKMSNAAKVKEWADAVLFANYETIVETVGEGRAAKGKARGQKRVMYCQHNACWDAKNRWGLPDKVPFDYAQIAAFIPSLQAPAAAPTPTPVARPVAAAVPVPVVGAAPSPVAATPKPTQTIVYNQDGSIASNTAAPAVPPATDLPGYFAPLLQLMQGDGIDIEEVREICAAKGYFTADTPFANYPEDFVGYLISVWPQVSAAVKSNVPFN